MSDRSHPGGCVIAAATAAERVVLEAGDRGEHVVTTAKGTDIGGEQPRPVKLQSNLENPWTTETAALEEGDVRHDRRR